MHAKVVTEPIEFDDEPTPDEARLYSRDSARVRRAAVDAIGGWTLGDEGSSWSAVESALAWLPQRLFYVVGATDAQTPIETVLQLGHGVCQDFAHVFLALLRRWGWCARYVSGYMFSDVTRTSERIEAQAMHAWVEVYRPGSGWIGMDATAGTYADDRYVPVGYGRDYDDVRPIRGVLRGWTVQKQSAQLQMMRSSEQ